MEDVMQKIPPQNIEAEMCVLGALLIEQGALSKVSEILSPDSFYKESHRKIFAAILNLRKEGKGVDLVALVEELRKRGEIESVGGARYISALADAIPTAANIEQHARIVKEKFILRKLIETTREIMCVAYEGEEKAGSILAFGQRRLSEVLAQSSEKNALSKFEFEQMDLMRYFSCRETPFKELNKALGGFFGGDLIVVGGRPGMGKTSFVLECLKRTAMKEKRPAIYFGCQTAKQTIYMRLLSSMCNIDTKDLKRGNLSHKQTDELMKAHKMINSAPIYLLAAKDRIDTVSLIAQARSLVKEIGVPGLIVIENVQQLAWPEKFTIIKEEMDVILSTLKTLAIEIDAPIILSSQISRHVDEREDKRPLASDLKETGRTEDLADKILLLYRENYYTKSAKDSSAPEDGEIIIAKGGPSMTMPLKFYGKYLSWRDA